MLVSPPFEGGVAGRLDYLLFTRFISRPGWLIQQTNHPDQAKNILPGDFTYLLPGHPSFKKEGKVKRLYTC